MTKKSRSPEKYLVNKRLKQPKEEVPTYVTGALPAHEAVPIPDRLKAPRTPGRAQ